MVSDSIPFSKKDERKISGFVGQELLYDYVTSNLDPDRAAAVEEFVKSSREAQADIQRINDGMNYVEHLSEIQVSDALLETIKTPSSYVQVLLRKLRFEDWSPGIKMGLEVMIVAVGVISITLILPWHKLMDVKWPGSKDVLLTEVEKTPITTSDVEVAGSPEDGTVMFPDEVDKTKKDTAPAAPTVAKDIAKDISKQLAKEPPKEAPKEIPKEIAKEEPKKKLGFFESFFKSSEPKKPEPAAPPPKEVAVISTTVVATQAPVPAPVGVNPAGPEKPKATAKATKEDAVSEKRQGFLYRGIIKVTNVSSISPKFAEKITELGGRKAGEVELGWKKGNSGYFHFTIPEAKYQALLDFSKDYGNLSLQKEKHDRVMPEGIVRIIFTIEEKK